MREVMYPRGLGVYIWDISRILDVCGGSAAGVAGKLAAGGVGHALIKVADGSSAFNQGSDTGDLVAPLVRALRAREIQVWGWHYVYGGFPAAEAKRSLEMIHKYNLEGFVINAEVEYKNRSSQAVEYVLALQAGAPDVTLALSSYRFPTYHRDFPWKQFLSRVDLNMPQVYWLGAHNPSSQLRRCVAEFENGEWPLCPIIPTGAAFLDNQNLDPETGKWWQARPEDVAGFLATAEEMGFEAASFWELGNTLLFVPELWEEMVAKNPWGISDPQSEIEDEVDPLPTSPLEGGGDGTLTDPETDPDGDGPSTGSGTSYKEGMHRFMELTGEVRSWLNIRSGPGLQYGVVGRLYPGEQAAALEIHDSLEPEIWVRVGVSQWCCMVYQGFGELVAYGRFVVDG